MRRNKEKRAKWEQIYSSILQNTRIDCNEKRGWGTAQTGSEPLTSLDLLNEIKGGLGYMLNSAKEYNGR